MRKLEADYDPTDRLGAMHRLQWAQEQPEFITGLIYHDVSRPSLAETLHLDGTPLSMLADVQVRPAPSVLDGLMSSLM